MRKHTLVCPLGFVERFGKCVPKSNSPDAMRADLFSGNVVPFVPDNVPDGGGGDDGGGNGGGGDGGGSTYWDNFEEAYKVYRYTTLTKKAYESAQRIEQEMNQYVWDRAQRVVGEEEETEVIMFNHPEEVPLTSEELKLRALTKQYREAEQYEDVAAATEKYEAEQEYKAIIQKMNGEPAPSDPIPTLRKSIADERDPPRMEADDPPRIQADQLDKNFDPKLNEPPDVNPNSVKFKAKEGWAKTAGCGECRFDLVGR
jgi:hypothetical protein